MSNIDREQFLHIERRQLVKKTRFCLLMTFAVLAIALVLFPRTALAEETRNSKIVTVKPGKNTNILYWTYDEEKEEYTDYMYKVKVPKGTYMKLEASRICNIYFYYGNKGERITPYYSDDYSIYNGDLSLRTVYYRALKPGTYYFRFVSNGGHFKITLPDITKQKNYCQKYATSLKKGKSVIVPFACGYECTRWYKFKLKKEQKVTFILKTLDEENDLGISATLDFPQSDLGNSITWEQPYKEGKLIYTSTKALPPGTYYISVSRMGEGGFDIYPHRDIYSLTWE